MQTINWKYKGKEFNIVPKGMYGFTYEIVYTDGTRYIGNREFVATRTLPELKSKKIRDGFIKKITKRVYRREDGGIIRSKKEKRIARAKGIKARNEVYDKIEDRTGWLSYEGSTENSKGKTIASKTILMLCKTKKSAAYREAELLFNKNAIFDEMYLNENILGSFWSTEKL